MINALEIMIVTAGVMISLSLISAGIGVLIAKRKERKFLAAVNGQK